MKEDKSEKYRFFCAWIIIFFSYIIPCLIFYFNKNIEAICVGIGIAIISSLIACINVFNIAEDKD